MTKEEALNKENILKRLYKLTKIDPVTNCHLFTGFIKKEGHAILNFRYDKVRKGIHISRLSAYIYLGLDLEDNKLWALHKLECLNKHCWNPEHIYIGTRNNNEKDKVLAGTHHETKKIKCTKGHLYSKENTKIYNGKRRCIECYKIKRHNRYIEESN